MAIRCQCTKATESQLREIFSNFAAGNPDTDITYDHVNEAMNEIGRSNAAESGWPGSGTRQCFGCDPMVHMLVKKFNESHSPDALFPKPVRKGGRKARLAGLCSVAASRDYTAVNDHGIPDLSRSPIEAPKKPQAK